MQQSHRHPFPAASGAQGGESVTSDRDPAVEQEDYRDLLSAQMQAFLELQRGQLHEVSGDAAELVDAIAQLAEGGKRLRALLSYWGWRGAGGAPLADEVVQAGVAIELFQAAALIHDDIIDRSATRRGKPSVHRRFELNHAARGWALDPVHYGQAAAILSGDMCLSFCEEVFAGIAVPNAASSAARRIFNRMRTEVMAGQYLDVLEEVAGPGRPAKQAVERAMQILRYKSAKYSTEHPLCLGGALAGADAGLTASYSAFGLPLGEAFQIRDDVLGVFGDPATTGKPAGDDLREGKRTVLVGLALNRATPAERDFLQERLGSPDLDDDDVMSLRGIIDGCGALSEAETMIARLSADAYRALDLMPVDGTVAKALRALADRAVQRSA
ncbi:dimethylallyltransferase [Arthrobacter crystallopoietes BAB-32]|uniref:Dimethylallyltransferase n=1 Tax=Arthrobacter crystallopoietes BAB-32 TaxID=1246476 RepID=N1UT61_9MICC|nr:polyprenyl synthetase family protein [Arthrobacter crystallopoietes]EMY33606.1 dimethylallyltransferase [Arthrobacter crystallopoietes BAB-32]